MSVRLRERAGSVARPALCAVVALVVLPGLVRGEEAGEEADAPTPALRDRMRDLWKAGLQPPVGDRPRTNLEAIIRELERIQVRPGGKKEPPPATAPASHPATNPAEQAAPERPDLPTELLERLRALPPEAIGDPLQLADRLFADGHAPASLLFYERAHAAAADDGEAKAWALYQMANCLRLRDPARAATFYQRVAVEHPDSAWASLAAVQKRMLDWEASQHPRGVVAAVERELADTPESQAEARAQRAPGTQP